MEDDGSVFSDYPQSNPAQRNRVSNNSYQDMENAIRERDENMGKSNKIILAQETELFDLRNKLKAATRDIRVLRGREEAFMDGSSTLTALKSDREEIESKMELLLATNAVLQGEKSQLAQKINLMEIDAQRLRDSLKSMQENDELTKKEIQLALAKSSAATTTEDEVKAIQWDLQNEIEKNATILKRLELEKQTAEVEKQRAKDFSSHVEVLKAKLSDTLRDLEDERIRVKDLKHQMEEARKSGGALSKETLEALRRELQEVNAERDQLVGQNQALASRTRQRENLLRDVEDERSGRQEAERIAEKLQREADSRQGAWPLEAIEKLQLLEDEGRKHRNENIELMQQVAKLERENLMFANRESKIAAAEESLVEARKAAEEGKGALEGAVARSRDAEERASKDREAAMQACEALMVAEERIASLMGELQILSVNTDQWEVAQEKAMRVLERNLEVFEGTLGSVGNHVENGNTKTQSLQAEIRETKKDLDHWRQLLTKKVQEEKGLKEELAEVTKQMEDAKQRGSHLEQVEGQLLEKEVEVERQREQMDALKKQLEGARKEARDVRGDGEGRMLSVLEKMREMSASVWKGETEQGEAIRGLDEVVHVVGQALERLHNKVSHWRAVRELGGKEVEVLRDQLAGKEEELGKLRIERVKDVKEGGALRDKIAKGEREAEKRQAAHARELAIAKEMLAMKEEQQAKQEEIDSRKLADLRERLARSEGELSRLVREQERERQRLAKSEQGLTARNTEHELALKRLDSSKQELTQLKKEHEQARESLAEGLYKLGKLREEHEDTKERYAASEKEVANFRREREQIVARQIEPKETKVEAKPASTKHDESGRAQHDFNEDGKKGTTGNSGAEEAGEDAPQRRVVKTSVAPVAKIPDIKGREKLADAVPEEEVASGRTSNSETSPSVRCSLRWRDDVVTADDATVVDPSSPETGQEWNAHQLERFDAKAAQLLSDIWGAEKDNSGATDPRPVPDGAFVRRHSVDTPSPRTHYQSTSGSGERALQQRMPVQRGFAHSATTTVTIPIRPYPGSGFERGRPEERQSYWPNAALPIGRGHVSARRSLSTDLAAGRTAPALRMGLSASPTNPPGAPGPIGTTDQFRGPQREELERWTPRELEITPRQPARTPLSAVAFSVSNNTTGQIPPTATPATVGSPGWSNAAVAHGRMEGVVLQGAAVRSSPSPHASSQSYAPNRIASAAGSTRGGAEFEVVPLKRVGRPATGGATPETPTPRTRLNLGEVHVESLGLIVRKGEAGLGGAEMVIVSEVVRGGPAARTEQVREGDVVLAVDGNWLSGLSLMRAAGKLEGETGGQVTLSMLRSVPGMAPDSFMVHVIRGKSRASPPDTRGNADAGGRGASRDVAAMALYGLVIDDASGTGNLKPQRMEDEDELSEEEWDA